MPTLTSTLTRQVVNRCQRCGGNLLIERDLETRGGPWIICLQCGAEHNPEGIMLAKRNPVLEKINLKKVDRFIPRPVNETEVIDRRIFNGRHHNSQTNLILAVASNKKETK